MRGEIRGIVDALKESQNADITNGREVVFTDERISANVTESVVSGRYICSVLVAVKVITVLLANHINST